MFESYNKHFKDVPEVFMGLEVKKFLERMRTVLEPVLSANPIPERGQIELDPERAPTIALLYDPFETGEAQRFGKPK